MKAQGLFINICAYYWSNECSLTLSSVQHRFNTCSTEIDELLNNGLIRVNSDNIEINFLDKQFSEFGKLRKLKSRAGKASAKIRKSNTRSTDDQQVVNKEDKIREDKIKEEGELFKKPTLIEVKEYCKERKNHVDVNKWYNHYESNGWLVGKNKMKNWKAAVRTWESGGFANAKLDGEPTSRVMGSEQAPEDFGVFSEETTSMPQSLKDKFNIK